MWRCKCENKWQCNMRIGGRLGTGMVGVWGANRSVGISRTSCIRGAFRYIFSNSRLFCVCSSTSLGGQPATLIIHQHLKHHGL